MHVRIAFSIRWPGEALGPWNLEGKDLVDGRGGRGDLQNTEREEANSEEEEELRCRKCAPRGEQCRAAEATR